MLDKEDSIQIFAMHSYCLFSCDLAHFKVSTVRKTFWQCNLLMSMFTSRRKSLIRSLMLEISVHSHCWAGSPLAPVRPGNPESPFWPWSPSSPRSPGGPRLPGAPLEIVRYTSFWLVHCKEQLPSWVWHLDEQNRPNKTTIANFNSITTQLNQSLFCLRR